MGAGLLGAGLLPASAWGGETALAAEPSAASGSIEVWHPISGTSLPLFMKAISAFQSCHPNINVKLTYASNDLSS